MINTSFYVNPKGELLGFRVFGHSGYSEEGSDVVCAAVSSAAIMTANTITDVLYVQCELTVGDGDIMLRIFQRDAVRCRDILSGFKLHMQQLEEQYSEYINVNYTEV
ncbi:MULTISPECIES: ribosomal-processing cysteine protease Prp [unclassified Ruminococcus]|uniref:ribosomal-processing cysteine protease Prp n=1 Tax=unclassified Ruminococcus TaxID=2608920 RepID=UPI00210C2B6F|nr:MULTISPECIES: ribosomal-processing cysteine protease Prp [unclassified Ruminococcus]MCQ4021617.1 ribosomal-processing cysteine protease Prp [Ruminococcus sp. zg-924]MCQ4114062.1 ribosomal-processing cysteine protease Prp [Ruminococcus sp. zg-921]